MNQATESRARKIRLLILDVDGVMSDGRIYFDSDGRELKSFNTLDGHGIKMLQNTGVKVGIITGRKNPLVEKRARDLKINILIQGREDKLAALAELREAEPVPLDRIAFMGDDWPDVAVMRAVGLALTVPNAHEEVKKIAHWQSTKPGGSGAVREACDAIMQAQNTYDSAFAEFL